MIALLAACTLLTAQGEAPKTQAEAPPSWTTFYLETAKQYKVVRTGDGELIPCQERPVFNWASIDDYHGAVFAWIDRGRPTMIGTVFSFPVRDSKERLGVHEFASLADTSVTVQGPNGIPWTPPPLQKMQLVPEVPAAATNANLLKLQGRRLAKDFSAHMNRRGDRWDLRLLPTPLFEYQSTSEEILGGGLFGFVGYSTDPEILLLLEARKTPSGPVWFFQPVRFSDKSLYLQFKEKPIWESLRTGHGTDGPNTDDPQYRVLTSKRIPAETVEKLSSGK